MTQQYDLSYSGYNSWVMPLNLAIAFHVIVAFSVVYLPDLLKSRPKYEDIYTVNLVNIAEPAVQQPAPAPEPVLEAEAVTEPPPSPEAVPIAEPAAPAPPPEVVEPVSLKPAKRKIKKKIETERPDRSRELEQLRRERIAEAMRAEQLAAEQARIAAEEAERQRRLMEQQLNQIRNQVRAPASPRAATASRGSSGALNAIEKQYLARIQGRLKQFWSLPEFKQWDDSTQAVVTIRIARDGRIIDMDFERRSGDSDFDRSVQKTLKDASPLPTIPPAIRDNSFEIGLVFRPGDIQ